MDLIDSKNKYYSQNIGKVWSFPGHYKSYENAKWKWGDFHKAVFRHPILGHVPILSLLVNLEIPSDGGNFTVNRGSTRFSGKELDFAHIHYIFGLLFGHFF